MEYASIVWSPYLNSHINSLKKVQKFAIKVCLKIWDSSLAYDDLLQLAELLPLKHRREVARLCHLFKILLNLTDYQSVNNHIKRRSVPHNSLSINEYSLAPVNCRKLTYKNSFFPKTIEHWNKIAATSHNELLNCTSFVLFKLLISNLILCTNVVLYIFLFLYSGYTRY